MLRIRRIRAEDFLSFKEIDFQVPDAGLFFVGGMIDNDPARSNGSGKSTIWEIPVFALYGKTVREVSGSDVIRFGTSSCFVEVEFSVGDDLYVVKRFQYGPEKRGAKSALQIIKNGLDISDVDIRATQAVVEEAVGASYNLFTNSVIFGQGLSYRFAQAPDSEKKEIFDQLLDLGWLSDARDRSKALEKDSLRTITELEKERALLALRSNSLQEEAERWLDTSRVSYLEEAIKEHKEELLEERRKADEFEKEVDRLSSSSASFDKEERFVRGVREDLVSGMADVRGSARRLRSYIEDAEREISFFAKEVVCSSCKQKVDGSHADRMRTEAREKIEFSKYFLREDETTMQLLSDMDSHCRSFLDRLRGMKESFTESLSKAERSHSLARTRAAVLQSGIRDLEKNKEEEERKEERILSLVEEAAGLWKKVEEYDSDIREVDGILQSAVFWSDAFGNKGIKSLLIESVIGWMNTISEKLSDRICKKEMVPVFSSTSILKGGVSRETMSIQVRLGNRLVGYKVLSGGQKRRVDIIVILTLCKLLATVSGRDTNLLVFDEVFESMDSSGAENVVEVLKEFSQGGRAVFVVSHSQDEGLRSIFDNHLIVSMNDSVSKII